MQISIKDVHEREDPYQLFLDSIKNSETKRKYKNILYRFLKLIPNKFYEDSIGHSPKDTKIETLVELFVHLTRNDPKLAQNIIATFIKEEKKLVESGELNPNTLPNHIKPIKALLDANSIALHWKTLHKLYPRPKKTQDRAYTRQELQQMIEASPDITDKLIIQLFSSGGFRLEAWDYFTWKDVIFFKNDDNSYQGAALLVYRGDPESYWTFITPETCHTLDHYREVWKSNIGRYPKPDEPLIKSVRFPVIRRLNALGVKRRIQKIVKKIGLRPSLPEGKKRHDVPLDHGFRKYFNTMMRRAKVNFLDKEDMMGHSVGLERHYERYQEDDFERFPEYQKAIPFLTISAEEIQRIKIENQKKKITQLQVNEERIINLEEELVGFRKEQEDDKETKKKMDEIAKKYPEETKRIEKNMEKMFEEFSKKLMKKATGKNYE